MATTKSRKTYDLVPLFLPLLATVVSVVLGVIFTWLVVDINNTLRGFEHRLTVLETRAESKVGSTVVLGGFPWQTSKGYDFTPEGKVRLGLDIDILSERFRWKCGSPKDVVLGDAPVDLAEVIQGYKNDRQLKDALAIIAVGTASTEGLEKGQEQLAQSRYETLIDLLDKNTTSQKLPIYGYWLGQYTKGDHDVQCTPSTANQRRVVLLKITSMERDLPLEALGRSINAILLQKVTTEGIGFPIDVRDYSRFQRQDELLIHGRNIQQKASP